MTPHHAKALGAFYTDTAVARFLVDWAVRGGGEYVLDPSLGGGVFLEAAAKRLESLSGNPSQQIRGAEIDPNVHAQVTAELHAAYGIDPKNLLLTDFFDLAADKDHQVDVVVGNPPFIRYQQFSAAGRQKALERARAQGVKLSRLSSSWAAFLVHSVALLKPGGRLGMVIPAELAHASYARLLLEFLKRSFATFILLTFEKPLFPHLSQDTLLLLAERKGQAFEGMFWQDMRSAEELDKLRDDAELLKRASNVDASTFVNGQSRLSHHYISSRALELYQELAASAHTQRLGDVANVGIGYVTGANRFFQLTPEQAREWQLPKTILKKAVFRGKALSGTRFTDEDWQRASEAGYAGYLILIDDDAHLNANVQRYLAHGEAQGVHQAYKCRVRTPWYRVPHVYTADVLLTYMSGLRPSLVANEAGAVASNTLHLVRLHPNARVRGRTLSALWQTSLTSLSVELEGHALGGGMLKLEPSEAKRVLLPFPGPAHAGTLATLAQDFDALHHSGRAAKARQHADQVILKEHLGLSTGECHILQEAAETLQERRYDKTRQGRLKKAPEAFTKSDP